jgi:pantoate--beta-alanine ligase
MIIFHRFADLSAWQLRHGIASDQLGFVPTMGALHQGHLSLIESSLASGYITVCSIFVNPTQFNNTTDFFNYPNTLPQDLAMLEAAGCQAALLPTLHEVYPLGTDHLPHYPLGQLDHLLEGRHRPGHFQGVCQVMHRLLQAIAPGHLFMGKKDYQQCMVVQWLLQHYALATVLHVQPTLRQANGLAMSSRNLRLSPGDAEKATAMYAQLRWLQRQLPVHPIADLVAQATAALLDAGFSAVDYVSIADAHSLEPIAEYRPHKNVVALMAAFMGAVRLIDNLQLYPAD